ncbi:hypothetical protein NW755_004342 [Fusarium falciforme]|uniref:Uncharacterized protein n=1 Tax=Fusarium falciforme TaxID=195108 RepID=A0A9W8R9X4_9HYPO|nr:hypothetical protein NW755_004342 [Fusarium falciforme]
MTLLPRTTAAMPLPSVNPDYQSLVLANCRSFHGSPDADYELASRLDTSNQWHLFVLKTEKGKRTKILSGTATHPSRAMEILHENSARLVDQHVSCHGYDLAPTTTTKPRAGLRGGEVRPEVIALCGSSDTEDSGSGSDSDLSEDEQPPPRMAHRRSHRAEAVKTRRSRLDASVASDVRTGPHPAWGPMPLPLPQRPAVVQNPPPGWNNPVPAPIHLPAPVPAPAPAARPPPPPVAVMPPPPRAMPIPLPGQKTHAALLVLHLIGTGKKNMVAQVVPTAQFLQQTATGEATLRPMSFINASSPTPYPPPMRGNTNYRAMVRRVTLGDETYDMASFGNDLGALFRNGGASSTMPKFEIDINVVGNFFPAMPPPPPRPASVASSASSGDIVD